MIGAASGAAGRGRPGGRAAAWIVLGLLLSLSLVLVLTPAVLIQPFRAQTDHGVHVSYVLRSFSPAATLGLLVVALGPAAMLFRRLRRFWSRAIALLLVALLAGSAWLARQNHFEWMFHPIDDPRFAGIDAAHGLEDDDLVLGVVAGSEARAYPVRALAYHHVLNDEVDGRAVVATY